MLKKKTESGTSFELPKERKDMPLSKKANIKELGATLLEVGAMLLSAGANTGRVRTTLDRVAAAFGFAVDLLVANRSLILALNDPDNDLHFSSMKRTTPHGVNFKIVSGISRMSWQVVEEGWSIDQIKEELERLKLLPHYARWMVILFVGLAGASFCRLAGGTFSEMLIVFAAAAVGLVVRQEATRLKFNPYLCIYFASLTAALIAGLSMKVGAHHTHEHAWTTSVLFLIPGVPLINSFSDLIDGNLQNAVARGLNGLIISFAIALGLVTTVFIYQL